MDDHAFTRPARPRLAQGIAPLRVVLQGMSQNGGGEDETSVIRRIGKSFSRPAETDVIA